MNINTTNTDTLSKTGLDAARFTDSGKLTKKDSTPQDKNIRIGAYSVQLSKEVMGNAKIALNPGALIQTVLKDSVAALAVATNGLSEKSLELLR